MRDEHPQQGDGAGPREALRLLFWLRMVAIGSQALVIGAVHAVLGIPLPLYALAVPVGMLAGWNAVVFLRLRARPVVSHSEVTFNLAVDIAAFTAVIYLTGGATNPFVSLYLVPIALAATSLPARHAWFCGALCAAGYSLLLVNHVPLPSVQDRFGGDFDLHIVGMWIHFLVAAALVIFFVGRMARLLRHRERQIATMRETALRNEQIVVLGTMAAGTAHELNTPLSTLTLLVEELEDSATSDERREVLRAMKEQIETMNDRLNEMTVRAGARRSTGARPTELREFLESLITQWREAHPGMNASASYDLPESTIVAEATIGQAIRNVLDNAAQASRSNHRSEIEVVARCADGRLTLAVLDAGTGFDPGLTDSIGSRVLSTKDHGLGIGLLLSRAALQRFGGSLQLLPRAAGGVEARIDLPLQGLLVDAR